MSFAIESVSSINSRPTGVSIVKNCDRARFIGQGIEFKVHQGKNISHVNAKLALPPIATPPVPIQPPTIESSTISDNFLVVTGKTTPLSQVRISGPNGFNRIFFSGPSGKFRFILSNPTGGTYKMENIKGEASHATMAGASTQPSGMQYTLMYSDFVINEYCFDPPWPAGSGCFYDLIAEEGPFVNIEGQTYPPDWAVCDTTGTITTLTELNTFGSDLLATYTGDTTYFEFKNIKANYNTQYELVQLTCDGGFRFTERFTFPDDVYPP